MKPFLLLMILFSATISDSQPVKEHGQLKVVGTQLTDKNGNAVVLRGMSFGWHNWWPRFYNKETVKWLAEDWKCSVVRAAMGVEPDQGYIKQPVSSTEKVEAVVKGAIDAGIYVIIDWHSHNINWNESKQFFAQMAAKYGKYPNVIYEIYNEPDYESWDSVKLYSAEIISTIRSFDPDNIILVGNPHWDQDIHLVSDSPLKGFSNIMYTMHFYAATHKQWLRDRCKDALKKGIPIFISESAGMEASGDGPIDQDEWKKWVYWAEENKISWITWSVSDKDETCSVLQKSASSEGNWKREDLKESGYLARELIRRFNK